MNSQNLESKGRETSVPEFSRTTTTHWNATEPMLYEHAILRNEAKLAKGGALCADTGMHTGRSPKDKFIVYDETTKDSVWWENTNKMSEKTFDSLLSEFISFMENKEIFSQDLFAGADSNYRIPVRVHTEYAWHSLFIRNLLIRPTNSNPVKFNPELTIICLPGFKANPKLHNCNSETVIAVNLTRGIILIGGTEYAGEMKKSVFTFLNFTLPPKGTLPMHCSANFGERNDTAIFFGLSGTGKTTLSTDQVRSLIGDDEHGWGSDGIFNFEGGCYAKVINLSKEAEPEIHATTQRFGTVLENVVLDEERNPKFDDTSKTENTRCAYPLDYIKNVSKVGTGPHPKNVIMLTADAFGVLPPLAKLSPDQAIFYFLSGYTAKLAGTERGVTEPEATFSACFGAPFMPCHPTVYGNLLKNLINTHNTKCWLVNTGWTGGAYGTGQRLPIKITRTLLNAALNEILDDSKFQIESHFGLSIPTSVPGVDAKLLDPRQTWSNPLEYDKQADKLIKLFAENFRKFESNSNLNVLVATQGLQHKAA